MTNQSGKMKRIAALGLFSLFCVTMDGQSTQESWSLRQCIDYARSNNIQVQTTQIAQESAAEDLALAKAQRLPSLSFSTSQNLVNQKQQQDRQQSCRHPLLHPINQIHLGTGKIKQPGGHLVPHPENTP